MTAGLATRLAILFLLVTQAVVAAVLGFAELLPIQAKIELVATSAGTGVALNTITSWTSAPAAERAAKQATPPE